jgi:hypothetical protein
MPERAPQPELAANSLAIERAVHAYFSRLFRWLAPLGVALVAVALIASTSAPDGDVAAGAASGSGQTLTPGDTGLPDSEAAGGGEVSGPGASLPDGAATNAGGPTAVSGGPTAGPPGVGSGGVAGNGTTCVQGARHVPWSKYSPPCVPAFSGSNGGATSDGVTEDKITITIGFGNTTENAAIQSLAGPATPNDADWAKTVEMYADYFNTQFETYGREVVVKTYQMKSDYVLADMGRDTAAAQADAQTAKDLGAFIDLTALTNTSSLPYGNALAQLGVMAWTFPLRTADDYAARAPYLYNFLPDGSKWAKWATNLVCQRMAGLPAIYAGGTQQGKPRKFGVIMVNIPEWGAAGQLTRRLIKDQCGVDTFPLTYNFDLGTFSQYGASMMAQMRSEGVTTILCVCDPLGPIFMTQSATDDDYFPEWIYHNQGIVDSNYDAQQLEHSFSNGPALPPSNQTEAFRVFRAAYPGQDPPDRPYFTWIYGIMMQIFSSVQMAGPQLTPTSFFNAMRSLPRSQDGGDYGPWWGDSSLPYGGGFTPWTGMQVTRWGFDAASPDGGTGYWTPCPGNTFYPFADLRPWGAKGTQLDCPA